MQVNRKDYLKAGSDKLVEQRKVYKDMRSVAKDVEEVFGIDAKSAIALKDFVHYYEFDWENNDPLIPAKGEQWRCRLSQPFRRVMNAINVLRETGHLYMLDPILKSLDEKGVHIIIDDNVKFDKSNDLHAYIEQMSEQQGVICNLADERKELRKMSIEVNDSTKQSFNTYVDLLARAKVASDKAKNKEKTKSKIGKLMCENTIDKNLFEICVNDIEKEA